MQQFVPIYGGKLMLGKYVQAHIKATESTPVIIFCGKNRIANEKRTVKINGYYQYTLIPLREEHLFLGVEPGEKEILYLNVDSPLVEEVIKASNCSIFACKHGIVENAKLIENIVRDSKEYRICSFDNDSAYVNEASKASSYENITYHKGIAHGIVTSINFDSEDIEITAGNEPAKFTFPPSMKAEDIKLRLNVPVTLAWKKEKEIEIARTEALYKFTLLNKMVSVNMHHTCLAALACKKGLQAGESRLDIEGKTWSDFLEYREMIDCVKDLHMVSYGYLLYKLVPTDGFEEIAEDILNYKQHFNMLADFVQFIYHSNEQIGRAISITKETEAKSKYESHIGYLKEAVKHLNDTDVKDKVIDLLNKAGKNTTDADLSVAINFCKDVIKTAEVLYG